MSILRFSVEADTDKLPVSYHLMMVSLFKEAFRRVDKNYYKKLYVYDKDKVNKKSKDFCFGIYMKGFKKVDDVFEINDGIVINISTPNYDLFNELYNGLLEINDFRYKNFRLDNLRIKPVIEKEIKEEIVEFKTLSPICIKDRDNQFLDIDDENYIRELNYIVNQKLENYRDKGLKMELEFKAINFRKVVVKQQIDKFTENTGNKYYYVNSYKGAFELKGDIEDLKDIYKLGIGFKTNQGFGMVEVVG